MYTDGEVIALVVGNISKVLTCKTVGTITMVLSSKRATKTHFSLSFVILLTDVLWAVVFSVCM